MIKSKLIDFFFSKEDLWYMYIN